MLRTLTLETISKIGQRVTLLGWVDTRRDHGKIVFVDLRDRKGIIQVVARNDIVGNLRNEDVIKIEGTVQKRPEKLINPKIETGTVEISAEKIDIISHAGDLPFPIDTVGYDIEEEQRVKYRYLDLRRPRLQKNIKLRSQLVQHAREFLFGHDFIEIETPLLTKSPPEGSRDFLVPSRMQKGKFYALPQSPQQYKQLLMIAGFERYFQIARCIRDEDLRSDRGFEHTQIDIEMSFVDREDVMHILEKMILHIFEKFNQKIPKKPFPVFTYREALEKFGSDKFDLRSEEEKKENVLVFAWVVDFPFFEKDKEGKWTFTHNPFSNPKKEFIEDLLAKKNIDKILTTQYDLVCNGYEVGGGSIRSHDPKVLESVFEIIGYKKDEIQDKFGHMLKALSYGTPPHGGCAFGVERLTMILTGEEYLREVVAFPMTAGGKTAVMDAPSTVDEGQLKELGIQLINHQKKGSAFQQIIDLLNQHHIEYKLFEHKPVFTSEDASKIRNTPLHEGAKALVMMADDKPIILVLPADLKVDNSRFKKIFSIKDLRMATPDEVEKLTGVKIGAVPPFGNLFQLPLYIDQSLFENEKIVFNAGDHSKSIQISSHDYQKVAAGQKAEFAINKHAQEG